MTHRTKWQRGLRAFLWLAASMTAMNLCAAQPTADDLKNTEWIAAGRARFVSACAYCHGQEGTSGKSKSFKERPGWEPVAIHDVIAEGRVRAGNVMPAWKGSIPDDDIWKLVAFIKSLTPEDQPGSH